MLPSVSFDARYNTVMDYPVVSINQGKLKGSAGTDYNGEQIYKFQGIPYAKPPVGALRFKDPAPPDNWEDIYDATQEQDGCYAPSFFDSYKLLGSEDCLYLNVYTKNLPNGESELKPVMVYIHGGGFICGPSSENIYGPEFLMTEDIVLVVIAFRIGLLGFFSLDDPSLEVPGNASFKDMVMALKWIHTNIEYFNGDKNNVTIFGESAGAASVHLLMLSPLTEGLIHRVIAQSGCGLNAWARGSNPTTAIAATLGISQADEQTVLNALMEMSVEEIMQIQQTMGEEICPNKLRYLGYRIEYDHPNAFLIEDPIDIVLEGKSLNIPFMTGYTTLDGYGVSLFLQDLPPPSLPEFERDLPYLLGYKIGEDATKEAVKKLKQFYYGDGDDNEWKCLNTPGSIKRSTDVMFFYFLSLAIKYHSKLLNSSCFLYRMSVDTKLNLYKRLRNVQEKGALHVDELGYLFKSFATPEVEAGSLEEIAMRRFVKLWTNFAKYGNPTPNEDKDLLGDLEWKPVEGETFNFLDIGEELIPGVNPDQERFDFWQQMFANSPCGGKYV